MLLNAHTHTHTSDVSHVRATLTQVPHSSCASNTVDVLLDVAGQIKVYDVFDIRDVQTSSCHLQTHTLIYSLCL